MLTSADIEGPYYRAGAPFATCLPGASKQGTPLIVSGRVLADDGLTPLADAIVDVWHADADGHYDNETDDPDRADPNPGPFSLRSRLRTDALGRYAFRTVMPGRYLLEDGTRRPAHIHYKVHVDDVERLTTQLYFAGDPWLAHDRWADASRTIVLAWLGAEGRGGFSGVFDLVVAVEQPSSSASAGRGTEEARAAW